MLKRPLRTRLSPSTITRSSSSGSCQLALKLALALTVTGCASSQTSGTTPGDTRENGKVRHAELPPRTDIGATEERHKTQLVAPVLKGPVSLESILTFADANAPPLIVARSRLGLGDAAVAGASPLLPENPEVAIGVGPGLNDENHVDFTAGISQRLEIAGERGLRLEAAERLKERLAAEYAEERWNVHRDVHAAFHRALVARERRDTAERLLKFQERLVEITNSRLKAGDVSPLSVRLAEGELSQARVSKIAAEQEYLRTRLELGVLAGWPNESPPEPAGHLDPPRDPPTFAALLSIAEQNQPRLRTLGAERAEIAAREKAADREKWPEPTFGLQVNRESFVGGPPETQVMGSVSVPIPVSQRNQQARAEARAEAEIVDARQTAYEVELRAGVQQHRAAVLAAAEQVRTYGSEILPNFEENLRLIQRAFELGEIDILQVSVARERFLKIQAAALEAYDNYFQATASLEGAIGADLWPDEAHDHDTPDDKHGEGDQ